MTTACKCSLCVLFAALPRVSKHAGATPTTFQHRAARVHHSTGPCRGALSRGPRALCASLLPKSCRLHRCMMVLLLHAMTHCTELPTALQCPSGTPLTHMCSLACTAAIRSVAGSGAAIAEGCGMAPRRRHGELVGAACARVPCFEGGRSSGDRTYSQGHQLSSIR